MSFVVALNICALILLFHVVFSLAIYRAGG